MAGDLGNPVADDLQTGSGTHLSSSANAALAMGGGMARVGTRNEVPSRHLPSPNARSGGGWPATQPRPLPPSQAGPPSEVGPPSPAGPPAPSPAVAPAQAAPAPAGPPAQGARTEIGMMIDRRAIPTAREETVELRAVPTQAHPPTVAPVPAPAQPGEVDKPTGWPARPAPDDAAAEVWALVERAQGGDADAFGLIYDRYMDTVFRFIYFRVGNRPLAEDLTSDTFLRALKRIGSFTWQGRDLGAWLVTIARNLVADHFKSGRYRLEVTTGDVLDAEQADRGPEGSPELAVVDHITNVALLAAVKQLNPEQQECIVLRFLHGFSVAETAQAMGKNEGAIKALQYRAVRALQRLLPDGFQP
jgi:RNA polymerase sigma-70 factor, ECF subfamily